MEKNTALTDLLFAYSEAESAKYHLEKAVIEAHSQGASWAEIADQLYVSKQTAYNRYHAAVASAQRIAKWRAEHPEEAAEHKNKAKEEVEKMLKEAKEERTKAESKKLDAPAPAKTKSKTSARADALDEQQELIYSGYVNTGMQVIDWKAEQDDAARAKCPYCEQKGHYNRKNGNWYVYRGCTLTAADRAARAEQEAQHQERNA